MNKHRMWVVAVMMLSVSASLFAADGPRTSAGNTVSSDAVVNVIVPGIIGIDVESDIEFDFGNAQYTTPTGPNDCNLNTWPAGAACGATLVPYTPSTVTDTTAIGGTAGNMWIAIFSNKTGVEANMNVTVTAAAWTPAAGPGFNANAVRLARAPANNGTINNATFGPAAGSPVAIGAGLALKNGALSSSVFGWSRIDLTPDLAVPGNTTWNEGAYTADLTFTLSY